MDESEQDSDCGEGERGASRHPGFQKRGENHMLQIFGNPYEKSEISYALARNPFEKLEISYVN